MKNKIVFIKFVIAVLMAFATSMYAVAESITYTATYDYGKLTIGTDTLAGETYATIHYDDLFNYGAPGAPSLPVDYICFSVPYNATNFSVTATTGGFQTNNIGLMPYPCQASSLTNNYNMQTVMLPDTIIYDSGQYYPAPPQNAWVADEGFVASENHIITIGVMPISYRHIRHYHMLKKYEEIVITLNYDLTNPLQVNPMVRRDTALRSEGYRYAESLVVNPNSVINNAPSVASSNSLDPLLLSPNQNSYPYMIITTPELKHSLRRLVALKRQKGYNVKIATMGEVMSDVDSQCGDIVCPSATGFTYPTFTDSAGILRQYFRNHYHNNNTEYVLLVGDSIPIRYVNYINREEHDTIFNIPSDLYFCELNGDWSGDWGDAIERHCELSVGRIMAKTDNDVSNYTDKLLRFELQPYSGETDYRHSALFTICSTLSNSVDLAKFYYLSIFNDQHTINESYDHKNPSGAIIVDSINETHFGLISFMNYANPYSVITSGQGIYIQNDSINCLWAIDSIQVTDKNVFQASCSNSGLNNLNNKMYPSIGYSTGSSTFLLDHNYYGSIVDNDFANSFVLGKDYGGPAFIGYTRDIDIFDASELEQGFARLIRDNIYSIGQIFTRSKDYANYPIYTCITNNLCGDPEFSLGAHSFYVVGNDNPTFNVTRYDNSLQITSSGYARISYCNNEGVISSHSLNSGTTVINNISPNGCIMAFRNNPGGSTNNAFPYLSSLALQNTTIGNSQYVIASDVIAGNSIENSRTRGDVIVSDGVEYEIEASGKVTLEDGFKVELGATFAVYPACF